MTDILRTSPFNSEILLIFPESGSSDLSFGATALFFGHFVLAAKLFEASPFSAFSLHLCSSFSLFVLVRLRRQTAVAGAFADALTPPPPPLSLVSPGTPARVRYGGSTNIKLSQDCIFLGFLTNHYYCC